MLRVAVVDDESEMRRILCRFIERYAQDFGTEIQVEEYNNGFDLFSQKGFADIIFLDIEMSTMDGMETAKRIRRESAAPVIIFVTRMAQYAIEGYSVDALDFIVKPLRYESFFYKMRRAIEKAEKVAKHSIIVTVGYGRMRLDVESIYYVEVIRHKLIYHTAQGEVESWDTMKNARAVLEPFGFALCSVSYLVNLRQVRSVKNLDITVGGTILKISRHKKEEFMLALAQFMS